MKTTKSKKKADPLARTLRAAREAKGWTVYRLSAESGVQQSAIARIESGERTASWPTVCRLAAALGVSLDTLRGE